MTDSLPEGPRDSHLAAQFGAALLGGFLSDDEPDPASRLGRLTAISVRRDAGEITEAEATALTRATMAEVLEGADGIWVSADLLRPEHRHLGGAWIPFDDE